MKTEILLQKIIEAHGGADLWRNLSKVQFKIVSSGKLFELQGFPQDPTPRDMIVSLHEQYASMRPFGAPDRLTNFTADRIAIEDTFGEVLIERKGTPQEIHRHMMNNKWDALDRANFNGYALWTYLTTPFFMLMNGFMVTKIEPWIEDNESWYGLRVTFPNNIASHSTIQDFYFGDDYLLRRHDYEVDVAGHFYTSQYVYSFIEVNGIKLPTKRRAYKKDENGQPIPDELMVAIDLSEIRFS